MECNHCCLSEAVRADASVVRLRFSSIQERLFAAVVSLLGLSESFLIPQSRLTPTVALLTGGEII